MMDCMSHLSISELLNEYDRALDYTTSLTADLSASEISWRADENSSAIGWHLGHQPAVSHFMVRNLTAAEPPVDAELDALMDSATAATDRGTLPELARLRGYRDEVADRVRFHVRNIDAGNVGAPAQLRIIAHTMMTAIINHEYQHSKWIGEVRSEVHGKDLPVIVNSEHLIEVDGYWMVQA